MDGGRLREIVTRLRRSVRSGGDAGRSDDDLLRRWVADRDPAAFEVLLWRHGPMVLGVCRRVLGRSADVDDVFQATFLALVQAARSVHSRGAIGAWLHTVAYRAALRARTVAASRTPATTPPVPTVIDDPGEEMARQELRAVLDEEVNRLPERYRAAVVLCYLEGRTNEEAARELGRPAGTVASRLARARELLRGRLVRRGLAPSLVGGMAAVAAEASAAPAPLIGSTLQAAIGGGVGSASTVPAMVLAKGVLQAMFMAKLKCVAAVVVTLAVLGTGSTFGLRAVFGGGSATRTLDDGPPTETPRESPPQEKEHSRSHLETLVEGADPLSDHPWAVKKYTFDMVGKPWDKVFTWLTEHTGKPVVTSYKPSGSLTLSTRPRGMYSIFEILDLINEGLAADEMTQKYILLNRERSFVLVPTSEKIDPTLPDRVGVEDLEKRGNREIVSVVMQLKSLAAEDVAPEVKKMLGPIGDVVPSQEANQLIVLDTVGNLKRIRDTIRRLELSEANRDETFKHTCRFVKAAEAARVLKDLLISDSKGSKYELTTDDATNTIFITGSAETVAQARKIVNDIDVGVGTRDTTSTTDLQLLKAFKVPAGKAEGIAKYLQKMYSDSPQTRIMAAGADTIVVYGSSKDLADVAANLKPVYGGDGKPEDSVDPFRRPDRAVDRLEEARDLVEQAKAEVKVKQAYLAQAKAKHRSTQINFNRLDALAKRGTIGSDELDAARTAMDAADAEVRIKEAELGKAELILAQAQRRHDSLQKDKPSPEARLEERVKELQRRLDTLQKEIDALRKQIPSK
jgi:RNA polymerase sigma factor (sigma-70 family)